MFNPQLKKVARFAKLMGIEKGNQKHIDLYVDLLQSEFNEFRIATRENDEIEIRDGLADIWVVAVQLNMLCGWLSNTIHDEHSFVSFATGFEELSYTLDRNAKQTPPSDYCVVDIVGWCERYANTCGYNLSKDVDEVMSSNLSKFCKTTEELNESMSHWGDKGFNVISKPTGDPQYPFAIYSHGDNGIDYPKGKLMKPLGYSKPNLEAI